MLDKQTVLHRTRLIPHAVALVKAFDSFAGIKSAFIAVCKTLFANTCLNAAFTAMAGLFTAAIQAAATGIFMIAMPVANFAVNSAGGKHGCIDRLFWHFHRELSLPGVNLPLPIS